MSTVFRDLGEKASKDAQAAILRTIDLIDHDQQGELYFSVVLSLCAHVCWAAHKAGGESYENVVEKVAAALRKAEAEYVRQENRGLN